MKLIELIFNWENNLNLGDLCPENSQLKSHIICFGEEVLILNKVIKITKKADILIIIGTSMQVYPATNLINYAKPHVPIYFINPKPVINKNDFSNLTIIIKLASKGVP